MNNMIITKTELDWIINALQSQVSSIKKEMDLVGDGSPLWALGETIVAGREKLLQELLDNEDARIIHIRN